MADAGGIGADRLRSFVERIERLEEEKAALTADIREVYSEAKGDGFDTKVLRQVVRLRKMDSGDRQEQEAILDLRSEEHTSELQSLMRISYAVLCLKKKKNTTTKAKYKR